jgi:hypothetical protein
MPFTAEINTSAYEIIRRQKEFNLLTDVDSVCKMMSLTCTCIII